MTNLPKVSLVRRLAITVWLGTMLAGAWSLSRLDPSFISWGFLAEARYWFAPLLAALSAVALLLTERSRWLDGLARTWIAVLVLLHLFLIVSTAWAPDPARAFIVVPEVFLLCVFLLLTPLVFGPDIDAAIEFLMVVTFWAALLYVAGGMTGRWEEFGRMAAFGGGANVFARVMGMGLAASVYLWATRGSTRWLWGTPLFAYGAVMSGSRGGLLAIALAGGAYLWHVWRRYGLTPRLLAPMALVTLILFALRGRAILDFWQWRFIDLTVQQAYGSERGELFASAIGTFVAHPVLGIGLDGFNATAGWVYPHNIILHIAAEGGAIGLMLLAFAAGLLIRRLRSRNAASFEQVTALAVGGMYFVASMFSGGLYDARFVWLYGLLVVLPRPAEQAEHPRKREQ